MTRNYLETPASVCYSSASLEREEEREGEEEDGIERDNYNLYVKRFNEYEDVGVSGLWGE